MKRIFRWIQKRWWVFLSGLIIIFFVRVVWLVQTTQGYRSAGGIYITTGGESYLVIEPGILGTLHVREGQCVTEHSPFFQGFILSNPKRVRMRALFRNNRLILRQFIKNKTEKDYYKEYLTLVLTPSSIVKGDWDLIEAEQKIFAGVRKNVASSDFWREIFDSDNLSEFSENFREMIGRQVAVTYGLNSSNPPLTSFLHGIHDEEIPKIYQELFKGNYTRDILSSVRELVDKHPHDPYLDLLRIELEAKCGDPEISLTLREKWETDYATHHDRILKRSRYRVWKNVANAQHKGKEIVQRYADILNPTLSIDAKNKKIKEMFLTGKEPYYPHAMPFVPAIEKPSSRILEVPNFLDIQVHTKVTRLIAILYLLQGKQEEALDLISAIYRLGQTMNADGILISRLIGIAVRSIATDALRIYTLNACETPEDFEKAWTVLEKLNTTPYLEMGENLLVGEFPLLIGFMDYVDGMIGNPNLTEALIRHQIADTQFQLVRTATAAKYRFITTGQFPQTNEEFGPLLREGPPCDEYNTQKPVSFIKPPDRDFTVYSYGPDKTDDSALITYDATNGTISRGDLCIIIPREREFPFPKEAVHAATAYELLEQFPNGLPADSFADTRGRPLSIVESTVEHPVVIFSFGPNTDERNFVPYDGKELRIGDTVIGPIPTPPIPENATLGRKLQLVVGRAEIPETSEPEAPGMMIEPGMILMEPGMMDFGMGNTKRNVIPGFLQLEPQYDPTNGTVSDGDIYIELPR